MAIIITQDCIVCNACEPECPNNAIYEPACVPDELYRETVEELLAKKERFHF